MLDAAASVAARHMVRHWASGVSGYGLCLPHVSTLWPLV